MTSKAVSLNILKLYSDSPIIPWCLIEQNQEITSSFCPSASSNHRFKLSDLFTSINLLYSICLFFMSLNLYFPEDYLMNLLLCLGMHLTLTSFLFCSFIEQNKEHQKGKVWVLLA